MSWDLCEREIDRLVRARRDELVGLTLELIRRRPTYAEAPSNIAQAQGVLRDALRAGSMTLIEVPDVPDLRSHQLYVGVEEFMPEHADYLPGRHPIVRARLEIDPLLPTLALSGHIDVEPLDDHEWTEPLEAAGLVRAGRIVGRGASDMLGALAAFAVAVDVTAALGGPSMNVEVHSVPDEELGGNGTLQLLEGAPVPDYVLIGEPNGLQISEATLGFHHFVLDVTGRRSHMAGVHGADSSVEELARAIGRLSLARADLANAIRSSVGFEGYASNPLAIAKVRGGTDPAVPPVTATLEGVAFSAPGWSRDQVADHLLLRLDASLRARSSLRFSGMSFEGNSSSSDDRLPVELARALRDSGVAPRRAGFPSPCDLRLYRAYGSLGVVCGPGDLSVAHGPGEYLDIDRLVTYTKTLVRLLIRFGTTKERLT